MRWEGREESENVNDMRGSGRAVAIGGGSILVLLLALVFGLDPQKLAGLLGQGGPVAQQKGDAPKDPAEEKQANFTKIVFRDTEIVWEDLFKKMGKTYQKPSLNLFTGEVRTACGGADAAVGPFYCPGDAGVFIDLSFYEQMQRQLNAPGDFARAYVVAHEVGHHVQRLLGYSKVVDEIRATRPALANQYSVRLELQADYLAGVWAHHAQKKFQYLDKGDVETALNAANQIGDDTLQKRGGRGRVVPDSFTHGTSKQRMRWFLEGFKSGDVPQAKVLFELEYGDL